MCLSATIKKDNKCLYRRATGQCHRSVNFSFVPGSGSATPLFRLTDPDPGGHSIMDPNGSRSNPEYFLPNEKNYCKIGRKSLWIIKYWWFFLNFFKSLINRKDPEPDPDPWGKFRIRIRNCLLHWSQLLVLTFWQFLYRLVTFVSNQCCGSGIRCLFDPWIRDPVPFWPLDPGSGIGFFRIPDLGSQTHIFESLVTIFWVKNSRVSDPYSFLRIRIRIQWIRMEANTDPDTDPDPDPKPWKIL